MGSIRSITVAAAFFVTMMASADISQRACRSQFGGLPGETAIYRSLQTYDYDQYLGVIQNINQAAGIGGAPTLWLAPVQSGARSMLIVGDLDSEFAGHVLRQQEQNVVQSIFAAGIEGRNRYSLRYSQRFPDHFASVIPQNLDLVNARTNQRVSFQEIIAFFEVSHILENGSDAEVRATLINLLEHLKIGGTLRIFPLKATKIGRIQETLTQIQNSSSYRFQSWTLLGLALPDVWARNEVLRYSLALILQSQG